MFIAFSHNIGATGRKHIRGDTENVEMAWLASIEKSLPSGVLKQMFCPALYKYCLLQDKHLAVPLISIQIY
jgi:hypothetical protein